MPTETRSATERITDPIHRVSYTFERDGKNLWVNTWLQDGGHLPEHFHPVYVEYWEVLEGEIRIKLDGAWRALKPADGPVEVAINVRHELKNESGSEAKLRTHVQPAGKLEEFLTESARAANEGLYNARSLPTSWHGAVWLADFALRHMDETVMTSPPPAVQKAILPLVARFKK